MMELLLREAPTQLSHLLEEAQLYHGQPRKVTYK